jgi:hypothetical protein
MTQFNLANIVGRTWTFDGTGLATRFQSVTIVYGVQIIKNETTIAKHI